MDRLNKEIDEWFFGRGRIFKEKGGSGRSAKPRRPSGSATAVKPLPEGAGLKNLLAANNSPEVVVKIPSRANGKSKGLKGVAKNLVYISREGTLELENQDGEKIAGKDAVEGLVKDYEALGIPQESYRREGLNVVLSMPAGTNPQAVENAARAFAREQFPDNKWVMVLHTDTDEPHVHLNVIKRSAHGSYLNPRKNDLFEWRVRFAEKLREEGVACAATRRQHRGKTVRGQNGIVRHIRDSGRDSYRLRRQAEELAQALKQHKRPENPFLEKTLHTRGIIVSEYKSIARELYKLGYKTEARAISRLSREVENAGTATRAQQEYDRAVQAAFFIPTRPTGGIFFGEKQMTPEEVLNQRLSANREAAAENILLQALQDEDPYIRAAAAEHPAATEKVLLEALQNRTAYNHNIAQDNTETLETLLHILQRDTFLFAAKHSNATPKVLLVALQSKDSAVRKAAAENRNATPEILQQALQDESLYVREAAAKHSNATPEILRLALQDEDPYIREAAAANKKAPEDVLLQALQDENSDVRFAAVICYAAPEFARNVAQTVGFYYDKAADLSSEAQQNLDIYKKLSAAVIDKLPQEHQEQAWLNFYTEAAAHMEGQNFNAPTLNAEPSPQTAPTPAQSRDSGGYER